VAVGTGPLFPLAKMGLGAGYQNYLCYPIFPQDNPKNRNDYSFGGTNHLLSGGVITDGFGNPAQPVDFGKITEDVKYAWYDYPAGSGSLHPSVGVSDLNPKKPDAYSFVKAPRYGGVPMEVGPLARGLVNKFPVLLDVVGKGAKPGAVARHLCRALEAVQIGEAGLAWIDRLIQISQAGPVMGMKDSAVPRSAEGMGCWDAPRGALAHWIDIKNYRIKNYQLVVPSTWNASPRDDRGVRGQYEESLIGVPVPDTENPINIVRVIRSFDPCLACAIHLIDPETNNIKVFKVS